MQTPTSPPRTKLHRLASTPRTELHRLASTPRTELHRLASTPRTELHRLASTPRTEFGAAPTAQPGQEVALHTASVIFQSTDLPERAATRL